MKRTLAMLIDYMPIMLPGYLVCALFFNVNPLIYDDMTYTPAERGESLRAALMLSGIVHLVWYLHGALAEATPMATTFGKRIMGLRVFTLRGGRLSFGACLIRNFFKVLSLAPASLGFLQAIFSPGSRAWRDFPARAIVAGEGL